MSTTDHNMPNTAVALHHQAEAEILRLLESNGLPDPDEIVHGHDNITLLWQDRKVAIILDLDDDAQAVQS